MFRCVPIISDLTGFELADGCTMPESEMLAFLMRKNLTALSAAGFQYQQDVVIEQDLSFREEFRRQMLPGIVPHTGWTSIVQLLGSSTSALEGLWPEIENLASVLRYALYETNDAPFGVPVLRSFSSFFGVSSDEISDFSSWASSAASSFQDWVSALYQPVQGARGLPVLALPAIVKIGASSLPVLMKMMVAVMIQQAVVRVGERLAEKLVPSETDGLTDVVKKAFLRTAEDGSERSVLSDALLFDGYDGVVHSVLKEFGLIDKSPAVDSESQTGFASLLRLAFLRRGGAPGVLTIESLLEDILNQFTLEVDASAGWLRIYAPGFVASEGA